MVACPKCRSTELRIVGQRYELEWRPPAFGIFPRHPRLRVAAYDVACAECFYAFISRAQGTEAIPDQTAHERRTELAAAPAAGQKPREPAAAAPPRARPAPDPRVRPRPA